MLLEEHPFPIRKRGHLFDEFCCAHGVILAQLRDRAEWLFSQSFFPKAPVERGARQFSNGQQNAVQEYKKGYNGIKRTLGVWATSETEHLL
jgi:hypothetical protein